MDPTAAIGALGGMGTRGSSRSVWGGEEVYRGIWGLQGAVRLGEGISL